MKISFKLKQPLTSVFNQQSHNNQFNYQFKVLSCLFNFQKFNFTGPTETGYKFTTPTLRMRKMTPVSPPGHNLKAPEGWNVQKFFDKVGGDLTGHADKFESLQEIFDKDNRDFYKSKELPVKQRKYLSRIVLLLKRGLLNFNYLERRVHTKPVRKLTRPAKKAPQKKN